MMPANRAKPEWPRAIAAVLGIAGAVILIAVVASAAGRRPRRGPVLRPDRRKQTAFAPPPPLEKRGASPVGAPVVPPPLAQLSAEAPLAAADVSYIAVIRAAPEDVDPIASRPSYPEVVAEKPKETPARSPGRAIAVGAAVVLMLVIVVAALVLKQRRQTRPAADAVAAQSTVAPAETAAPQSRLPVQVEFPSKSLAIVPFENLSEGIDDTFLADALEDQLLLGVGRVADLTTISRASVMEYRPRRQPDLKEIWKATGAANVLQGSVRREGDRVRVTLTLTDVEHDQLLWTHLYDRSLNELITFADDVARELAATVRATITEEEAASFNKPVTANAEAFLLYLRAHEMQTRLTVEVSELNAAVSLYRQAVALDPRFALAHAALSRAHSSIHQISERTEARAAQAKASAQHALQVQPDLAEGRAALGLCYYWGDRDYDSAFRELAVAAERLPNDSGLWKTLGLLRRRQGSWRDAVANLERAALLDPRNPLTIGSLGDLYVEVRNWEGAGNARQKLVALAAEAWPELAPKAKLDAAAVEFWRTGTVDALHAALAEVPPDDDPEGEITFIRYDTNMLAHDYEAAEHVLTGSSIAGFRLPSGSRVPKSFLEGCIALAQNNVTRARPFFEEHRPALEADAQVHGEDPHRHAFLGMLYAFLGRKQDAIREGQRAVDLAPEFFDAVNSPQVAAIQALIFARTGQPDNAIALIERLLTTPASVSQHITLADLRLRWEWDPLRSDPRFQKILASPEPKTVYQ